MVEGLIINIFQKFRFMNGGGACAASFENFGEIIGQRKKWRRVAASIIGDKGHNFDVSGGEALNPVFTDLNSD